MPSEQATLRQRAEQLAVEQRWDEEARRVNERLMELDPRDIAAHTRLARCCRVQGDVQSSITLYRRVLALAPTNRIARNALASIEEEMRVQRRVGDTRTYHEAFSRGIRARRRGDSVLALALLTHAVELNPSLPARIALAATHRDLRQLDKAEALCKEALAEAPDHNPARVVLAAVYRDRGALQAAESLAREVLAGAPGNTWAMRVLSGVYSDMGRSQEAKEWYERSE